MILISGAEEAFTLAPAATKQGIRPQLSDLGLIRKPCLVINRKGRIEYIGPSRSLPKSLAPFIKRDLQISGYMLPGWVECHTHSLFLGNRSFELDLRNAGESYQSISAKGGGILNTVQAVRKATLPILTKTLLKHTQKFLQQGVTTLEVKSGYGLSLNHELKMLKAINKANQISKIPIVSTFLGAHSKSPDFATLELYLENLQQNLARFKNFTDRIDIFIESGFFTPTLAKPFLAEAQKLGFKVTIHADQLSHSGGSQIGIQLKASSIDHVIHILDSEIQALANSPTVAVLLPIADLYLKCPYPPARKMIDQGCKVALSTDFNPGTSPTQSLGLLGALARLEMKMSTPEVITALTVNAAQALDQLPNIGSLEPGKLANFQLYQTCPADLFYSADPLEPTHVFCRGRQILKRSQT